VAAIKAEPGNGRAWSAINRARTLERGLVRVRWFGVAFGFFQIIQGTDPTCRNGVITQAPHGCEPGFLRPAGYALLAGLIVFNLLATFWLRRNPDARSLGRLGMTMFGADHLFLFGFAWLYSYGQFDTTWILLYILPLEGALRYGMRGALSSFAMIAVSETTRDAFRQSAYGFPFQFIPSTTFRIGVAAIIGVVAGMMAKNLEEQRERAETRAEQLEEAFHKLTELDAMKSDFIAITSHELRTPVTSIRGFIQTMRRAGMSLSRERIESFLEILDRQSERLTSLVEDLLFVSFLEGGVVDLRLSSFDVGELLNEVVTKLYPEQSQRTIVQSSVGHSIVSDRERLKRVITSLVDNAYKFSPSSTFVTVRAGEDLGALVIEVQDQGVGIPPGEVEGIFDRFRQVGGSMHRQQQGFGLGLYICSRIVQALSGAITVASTPGKGSTFTVRIPLSKKPAPTPAQTKRPSGVL
jgi:signal transduction histidine kinase